MSSVRCYNATTTLTPFLYPFLIEERLLSPTLTRRFIRSFQTTSRRRHSSHAATQTGTSSVFPQSLLPASSTTPRTAHEDEEPFNHLNPPPTSYSSTPFTDSCILTLHAGSGGHGCVSFVREKFISAGPANGGDGGSGGSIYIQTDPSLTSLHKLARQGMIRAERGKNGRGKAMGGERGADVVISVPVGTVVREVKRWDPVEEAEEEYELERRKGKGGKVDGDQRGRWRRDKWYLYPGSLPSEFVTADFPALPRPRRPNLTAAQLERPLRLDLDKPMESPMLLAAGAMGGLGNPHFVTKSIARPKFATKGEGGIRLRLELELKILADVGLVGLPNAGKSTLLRSLSRSRARVGDWAFTTLKPNIGTVVLDDFKGRPRFGHDVNASGMGRTGRGGIQRTNFTVADIPGLVEDAHLDKGLGLGFLRHIERAKALAFVVDLSQGDAWEAVKGLWKEVGEYETLKERELNLDTEKRENEWKALKLISPLEQDEDEEDVLDLEHPRREKMPLVGPPVSSKPWFVVATKADLDGTQQNFMRLQQRLQEVNDGVLEHPSGRKNAWKRGVRAVPVSAIKGEGVDQIPELVLEFLDEGKKHVRPTWSG